jgi:hypothetical protein
MTEHRNIFYTAGCHGNFLRYLFDSHDAGKLLESPFKENGNSHARADAENKNMSFDVCNEGNAASAKDYQTSENYSIVWQGFDSFFYAMSAYTDRGASLDKPGIALMEEDLGIYQDMFGVQVNIGKIIKEKFNYDMDKHGQPPRAVLRNYFLLSFYMHFDHVLWTKNKDLQKSKYHKIQLTDILDLDSLKACLDRIYGFTLDIDSLHGTFMSKNLPYKQLRLVNSVLDDVSSKKNDREISGLNVISEAYILFRLDIENFDIPFHVGNEFFKSIKDIVDYVDHFPEYMKAPNNLFRLHHEHYKRK